MTDRNWNPISPSQPHPFPGLPANKPSLSLLLCLLFHHRPPPPTTAHHHPTTGFCNRLLTGLSASLLLPLILNPGYTLYSSQSDSFKTGIRPYYYSVQNLYDRTWHLFHGLQGPVMSHLSSLSLLCLLHSSHTSFFLLIEQASQGCLTEYDGLCLMFPQIFE